MARRIGLRFLALSDIGTVLTIEGPPAATETTTFQVSGKLTDIGGTPMPNQTVKLAVFEEGDTIPLTGGYF